MKMEEKLRQYVQAFNAGDEECYRQEIPNSQAFDFLKQQIPLVDLPDEEIEKTYYFRWWTFRKHWKKTAQNEHILTEFLPPVSWSGPENSINCPLGHHLREGRWMRDEEGWMREEIRFWLETGNNMAYSMWFVSAAEDYFSLHPNPEFEKECYEGFREWFEKKTLDSQHECGLYWSNDDRDGMEYSISGSGIRPTLNSYLCADAFALSRMARRLGRMEDADKYQKKGEEIKEKIETLLWDGDFYRTLPCGRDEALHNPLRDEAHRARELVGYIPWYFSIPAKGREEAFSELLKKDGFLSEAGLACAEKRHPRFLEEHDHECLWNGYVWPFAVSQTLTALANAIRENGSAGGLGKEEYTSLLRGYARMHSITLEDGRTLPWIDEVMHPETGRWSSRDILRDKGWQSRLGGYERGKDYNHSTFCDLVLSGLLGIGCEEGKMVCRPLIPQDWDYFAVKGLTSDNLSLYYDKTGERYGMGPGIHWVKE